MVLATRPDLPGGPADGVAVPASLVQVPGITHIINQAHIAWAEQRSGFTDFGSQILWFTSIVSLSGRSPEPVRPDQTAWVSWWPNRQSLRRPRSRNDATLPTGLHPEIAGGLRSTVTRWS